MRRTITHGARWLLLPLIAGLVSVSVANAGKRTDAPTPAVTMSGTNPVGGYGAMGTIRKLPPNDPLTARTEIWCKLVGTTGGIMAWCGMLDDAGNTAECSTGNASLVATVGSINPDSYIEFAMGDPYNPQACTAITVKSGSAYYPKFL